MTLLSDFGHQHVPALVTNTYHPYLRSVTYCLGGWVGEYSVVVYYSGPLISREDLDQLRDTPREPRDRQHHEEAGITLANSVPCRVARMPANYGRPRKNPRDWHPRAEANVAKML